MTVCVVCECVCVCMCVYVCVGFNLYDNTSASLMHNIHALLLMAWAREFKLLWCLDQDAY